MMRSRPFPALLPLIILLIGGISLPAMAASMTGKVLYVSDGDTLLIRMEDGRKEWVRLAGIDAPEKDQPGWLEAKEYLLQRIAKNAVMVDSVGRDQYDRLIGVVTIGSDNLNDEQVRAGHAWVYRRYTESPALLQYEKQARVNRSGLWSEPDPVEPWKWRRQRRSISHSEETTTP